MKIQANEKIARALLSEVDLTFRRYYHQTLSDVVQDLRVHNILQSGDPSPERLLQTIHQTGLLEMRSASALIEMRSVLKRFVGGTISVCTRCGGSISLKDLEHTPTLSLCPRCQRKDPAKVPGEVPI